ncbi:hypothetical protein LTR66_009846 [Elasticomyces elasticus]|nr:hypothetical protein LTR66_009846 [Elasticomyces elasticus]
METPIVELNGSWRRSEVPSDLPALPSISGEETFDELIQRLSTYFVTAIESPHTFAELRTTSSGRCITPLIQHLAACAYHPAIVAALLALKGHFAAIETDDDRGVNGTRGYACEIVAWRFVAHLSEREAIDYLLYELPSSSGGSRKPSDADIGSHSGQYLSSAAALTPPEQRPLLRDHTAVHRDQANRPTVNNVPTSDRTGLASSYEGLNALEIGAVADAKKFLSQRSVQRIINGIWKGDIVFWETLSTHSVKQAQLYNKKKADPYCRLRVPRYLKLFEVGYFVGFLAFYYTVLVQRSFHEVTVAEIFLYIWIAGFGYNELGEFWDAGTLFYAVDFWSLWDVGIVAIGAAFLIARVIGLAKSDDHIIDTSFDILSLEALFLVPRSAVLVLPGSFRTDTTVQNLFAIESESLLRNTDSLSEGDGEHFRLRNVRDATTHALRHYQTKDFVKFLSLVVILYLGFLTTFTLLARDYFTFRQMSWVLVKIELPGFYISLPWATAYANIRDLDEHTADYIPHIALVKQPNQGALADALRPVRMCPKRSLIHNPCIPKIDWLTGTVLYMQVIEHAREEYLFVYSVFVLEASTSNRLTYFLPPLNLIPLLLRPLRLFLPAERLRGARIVLLKVTHFPCVALIYAYENGRQYLMNRQQERGSWLPLMGGPESPQSQKRPFLGASLRSTRPLAAANLVQPLDCETQAGRGVVKKPGADETAAVSGSRDELWTAVKRLSSQVETLTAVLAQLQQQASPKDSADDPDD